MSETLTIEYNLAELPSSQHRAGLAGLVLMTQWLQKEPEKKGVCQITNLNETSATLGIDKEGLQFLFDKTYAAAAEEFETNKLFKNKAKEIVPPLREIEREETDKNGKTKMKTFYVYPQVIPHGAFLVDYDRSENKIWMKLWRNMIWSILRGVPATRRPYNERAEGEFTDDADKVWDELNRPADYTVELPSTYFIGAQASNAEDVGFKDRARFQFLLHFWSFVAQIYVPLVWNYDRKIKRESPQDVGYSLVIPDVANLEAFCEEMPFVLKDRQNDVFGYRPKDSVVDIAAEGGLDLLNKINQRLATKVNRNIEDLVLGIDVVHLEKQGNNIRLWATNRIDPNLLHIDRYANAKQKFKNQMFRKRVILNILNEKEWLYGFDSLLSKKDSEQTIGNSFFRNDVRKAFEDAGVIIKSTGGNNMDDETTEAVPKKLEEIIYKLVRTYILSKVDSKYQLSWNKVKGTPEEEKYNKMKGKIARESFLAVRSRTDEDFVEYFTSTLCSFHQFSLNGEGFDLIAQALYDEEDRAKVRTLTMLALSANGYSPRENKEKTIV